MLEKDLSVFLVLLFPEDESFIEVASQNHTHGTSDRERILRGIYKKLI